MQQLNAAMRAHFMPFSSRVPPDGDIYRLRMALNSLSMMPPRELDNGYLRFYDEVPEELIASQPHRPPLRTLEINGRRDPLDLLPKEQFTRFPRDWNQRE